MKIRSGFISNSSSSSFVVVGIQLDEDIFEKMGGYEFFEEHFGYVNRPEGAEKVVLGERIGRWSDSDGDIGETDITEITRIAFELDGELSKIFVSDVPPIKLIYGGIYS